MLMIATQRLSACSGIDATHAPPGRVLPLLVESMSGRQMFVTPIRVLLADDRSVLVQAFLHRCPEPRHPRATAVNVVHAGNREYPYVPNRRPNPTPPVRS